MPVFFAHARGSVVQLQGQVSSPTGTLPFTIQVQDMNIEPGRSGNLIVTQAAIVENGNYQFLHTLNETIYVYVFGDRIGELRISGVAFENPCRGVNGVQTMLAMYRDNRLAESGGPVTISFGDDLYRGFLVGMSIDLVDPESLLAQWSLRFRSFFDKTQAIDNVQRDRREAQEAEQRWQRALSRARARAADAQLQERDQLMLAGGGFL